MTADVEIEGEIVHEETRHLPAVRAHEAMVTRAEVSVEDVIAQRGKIKAVMEQVMSDGVHYGRIPGVQKPTLFKSGAEVLNTTFRLAPSYASERIFHDDGHLTVISKCVLTHAPSGMVLAEGEGLCTSREVKYAWRAAGRACPVCGAEAIIKGKDQYGGGWLCWKNHKTTPGCGAKFSDGDQRIEGQPQGKVANPDLPDTWNTVLKMADKRALVAAVLNGTAASDIFTQDVEDMPDVAASHSGREPQAETAGNPAASAERKTPPTRAVQPSRPDTEKPITEPQKKKANVLVGTLRDALRLTTEEVYLAAGRTLPELAEGEVLRWSPLRESLTRAEASLLIDRLGRYDASEETRPPVEVWAADEGAAVSPTAAAPAVDALVLELLDLLAEDKRAAAVAMIEKKQQTLAPGGLEVWLSRQIELARKAAA